MRIECCGTAAIRRLEVLWEAAPSRRRERSHVQVPAIDPEPPFANVSFRESR